MSIGKCTAKKDRSKSSIQWSVCFSMNRGFQGKHLYAGLNVCILSVFHEGSWLLTLDAMKHVAYTLCFSGFYHNTVLWLVLLHWCLCCQLKCAFASLPTVQAVGHVPHGLRCLFPFIHVLHPWDLHDGYPKVLKLCVLVQWNYFIWQPSSVTSCHLCILRVCVVGCHTEVFCFFPQSVQTNASTAVQIRPPQSPFTSFPVYYSVNTLPFDTIFSELLTALSLLSGNILLSDFVWITKF
jgi:hypothetical protein